MTDEFQGVTKDEYITDRLLDKQDWSDWRAARGFEPSRRPTRAEMVAHFAADRVELEGVAERAVVRDGWRTYPDELRPDIGAARSTHRPGAGVQPGGIPTCRGDRSTRSVGAPERESGQ